MGDRPHGRGGLHRRSVLGDPAAHTGPMMTPMVDVVLVILIFFMGSATIAGHEWFLRAGVIAQATERDGTGTGVALSIPDAVLEVRLVDTARGVRVVGLGANPLTIEEARTRIDAIDARPDAGLSCVLSADPRVRVRELIAIHDALAAEGVRVSYR